MAFFKKQTPAPPAARPCCAGKASRDSASPAIPLLVGTALVAGAAYGASWLLDMRSDASAAETTLAMIKPDAVAAGKKDEILQSIRGQGFKVVAQKEYTLTPEQVDLFYAEHREREFFPALKAFMTSGPVVALALQRVGAILAWRALMGPTNTAKAKADAPQSLRALYGTDGTRNAAHGSDSPASAARELAFHFPELETTLAMIKPDAVRSGAVADIKKRIAAAGFDIVSERTYQLTEGQAAEFYAEHKERPFFPALQQFMTSGPVVALALRKANAIKAWRELMGPTSTDKAKAEAPQSLRALFGTDGTQNAAHGSDSFEAAARELGFHFPPTETTFAMVKPDAVRAGKTDEVIAKIKAAGFKVVAVKRTQLTDADVDEFYAEHVGKSFYPGLKAFMTSGPVCALALRKGGAIKAWRTLMGPTSTETAKRDAPESLRALYGTDGTQNACHGSDSHQSAGRELSFHFPRQAKRNRFWGFEWLVA